MSYSVKKGEDGWNVLHNGEVMRTYKTRDTARWNAKRFTRQEEERDIFFKMYRDLFGQLGIG